MCECNASVLKCIHLKINNSKNASGSWGISGCLKLPRACRCLRGPAMSTGCGLGTVILVRGGGDHPAGLLLADVAASSESTDALGLTDLGGRGGQLGLLHQSLWGSFRNPPVIEGLGSGGDIGAQWHRPSVSAQARGRNGRDREQAGMQRRPGWLVGLREGQWGGGRCRRPAKEVALGAADPGTRQSLRQGSDARRARVWAGSTRPSHNSRCFSGSLSQRGAQNRMGC